MERKAGQPTKRTPARVKRICELLASGLSFSGTAGAVGINQSTLHEWRKTDPAFARAVDQALADSEAELLRLAKAGAAKDGRIALMMLERRHPAEWSKRDEVQHLHAHATLSAALLERFCEVRRRVDAKAIEAQTVEVIAQPDP